MFNPISRLNNPAAYLKIFCSFSNLFANAKGMPMRLPTSAIPTIEPKSKIKINPRTRHTLSKVAAVKTTRLLWEFKI